MGKTNNKSESKRSQFSCTIKKLIIDELILSIDLDAEYQREKIWSTKDQQLLLDSIIKDIDIPKLYLAKTKGNKQFDYECIDGKQRMLTLLNFLKPEQDEEARKPLTVLFDDRQYTYEQLKSAFPKIAERIENYQLDFVVYDKSRLEDGEEGERLIREIFKRLQLGIRLNSGERLNALLGTMRDFVFKKMGSVAPFLRNTSLSEKRFSRQYALAQICLNSFTRKTIYEDDNDINGFGRARLEDLEDFFGNNSNLKNDDKNLARIRTVLKQMDKDFGEKASNISSRAVAVSAYLFAEGLYLEEKTKLISEFATFYNKLLEEIKRNMEIVGRFENPKNTKVLEEFQKYILQASVEPYSIRRRNIFLTEAFNYYRSPATKGKIIGGK